MDIIDKLPHQGLSVVSLIDWLFAVWGLAVLFIFRETDEVLEEMVTQTPGILLKGGCAWGDELSPPLLFA